MVKHVYTGHVRRSNDTLQPLNSREVVNRFEINNLVELFIQ